MWATVFKSVTEAILSQNRPKSSTENHNRNYNIQGHINGMPVDVSVDRRPGNSSANLSYRPPPRALELSNPYEPLTNHVDNTVVQHQPHEHRSVQHVSSNHSNHHSINHKNPKGNNDHKFVVVNKPKTGNKPKNNDSTFCMVKMPSHGNFKIHIEKTGSSSNSANNKKCNNGNNDNKQENKNRQFKQQNSNQNQRMPDDRQNSQQYSNNSNDRKKCNNGNNDNKQENKNRQFKQQNSNQNQRMPDNRQKSQQFNNNSNNRQNTWMYVGKLKLGTTESTLSSYLEITFPKNQFKIHSLPLYKDGKLPCFKVLVDNGILSEFQQPEKWPAGVTIKKYQHNFKA